MDNFSDILENASQGISNEELFNVATNIYVRFIDDDAVSMLNIPYSMKKQIEELIHSDRVKDVELTQEVHELMYEIKKEIFMLMFHDSFVRFRYTQPYKTWEIGRRHLLSKDADGIGGSMVLRLTKFHKKQEI